MYIPYLITLEYFLVSGWKQKVKVEPVDIFLVVCNVVLTELAFEASKFLTLPESFNGWHLFSFFVLQDVYFYLVHYSLHHYNVGFHSIHHKRYGAFYAWYCHPFEQLLLNVGSVAIPFILVPNCRVVLLLIVVLQVYTSVNGHNCISVVGSNKQIALELHGGHHLDSKKRFGSIYLMDRIFSTY